MASDEGKFEIREFQEEDTYVLTALGLMFMAVEPDLQRQGIGSTSPLPGGPHSMRRLAWPGW